MYSFASKRQSVTDEQLDFKGALQFSFWIPEKNGLFLFASLLAKG